MANRPQVASQIRFALSQLSAENAHHDFEKLCFELARLRICSNLQPATGPVSAGGDQGRDFETFRTYLWKHAPDVSAFLGLALDDKLVFACTLQQEDIAGKIRRDIASIMACGEPPARIYAFCEVNVPVARRHELKAECQSKYQVPLEILDGVAIADMLADLDTFWIATENLHVPAEMYPRPPQDRLREWYEAARSEWSRDDHGPLTPGNFTELRQCARYAGVDPDGPRQDVPLWIRLLEDFRTGPYAALLGRQAAYETAVVTLRSGGTLIGHEPMLREYFEEVDSLSTPGELLDAAVLSTYCWVAARQGSVQLNEELPRWTTRLQSRIQSLLNTAPTANLRCGYMEALGYTFAIPIGEGPDLGLAIEWWIRVLREVDAAPLFPVEPMADAVSKVAPALADLPGYAEFTELLDAAVASRNGRAAAAAKSRDRAVALLQAERPAAALRELHRAKVDWFSADTLRASLLAVLVIAQNYRALGLHAAAKYYALAAAFIADRTAGHDEHDLLAAGLREAGTADYDMGRWTAALHLMGIAMRVRAVMVPNGHNLSAPPSVDQVLLSQCRVLRLAEHLAPTVVPLIRQEVANSGTLGLVEELLSGTDPWAGKSAEEIAASVLEQIGALPFADLRPRRRIRWHAFGIDWTVMCDNDYHQVIAAERLAAIFQIVLADLVGRDLCFPPYQVELRVAVADSTQRTVTPVHEGTIRAWNIALPSPLRHPELSADEVHTDTVGIVGAIILELALLPQGDVMTALQQSFQAGLVQKITVAAAYDVIAASYLRPDDFPTEEYRSLLADQAFDLPDATDSEELRAPSGPGPTYSADKARTVLESRYKAFAAGIQLTLPRLVREPGFAAVVESLRRDGWRDWHILGALCSTAWSYRARRLAAHYDLADPTEAFRMMAGRPENEDTVAVPASAFTESALRAAAETNMLSSLNTWDLELHQTTPDLVAIAAFLSERYGYVTDDVPHEDPFHAGSLPPGSLPENRPGGDGSSMSDDLTGGLTQARSST